MDSQKSQIQCEDQINGEKEERQQRFFGAETPKTFNIPFGSLQDFLSFFEKRKAEVKTLINLFKDIECSFSENLLNKQVLPLLIKSLKTESQKAPNNNEEKDLIKLFEEDFTELRRFYGNVLKAYTMNGFLYKNMNLYLRNEDWTQLDDLLPYAFCLFKAFLCPEINPIEDISQPVKLPEKHVLYRGALFDENALSLYNKDNLENFSWNGVTSTSKKRRVAERFMPKTSEANKSRVMFIIEAAAGFIENNRSLLDVREFSVFPGEDEIILAPGSIFSLEDVVRRNGYVEIQLKLVADSRTLARKGQILHGTFQADLTTDRISRVILLEGKELSEGINLLKRNELIQVLEFCLCKFNEKAAESLTDVLPTISNLKSFMLSSVTFEEKKSFGSIMKELAKIHILNLEINEVLLSECYFEKDIEHLTSLETLKIDLASCSINSDKQLERLSFLSLPSFQVLKTLYLNFNLKLDILEAVLKNLEGITDQGLKNLCLNGLQNLQSLTTLNLDLSHSYEGLTDEGIGSLSLHGLKYLGKLTTLSLNLNSSYQNITDEALKHLSSGLQNLRFLRSLDLNFGNCQVTDEGLKSLTIEGIQNLGLLTSLVLNFKNMDITDEGLGILSLKGLQHLESLDHLMLNLERCKKITDRGISNLSTQGIQRLHSLTKLNLNFAHCEKVSDEGLRILSVQGINDLSLLTNLSLCFSGCREITDQGIQHLSASYSSQITTMSLDFRDCQNITEEGLKNAISQSVRRLPLLKSLDLNGTISEGKVGFKWKNLKQQMAHKKMNLSINKREESRVCISHRQVSNSKHNITEKNTSGLPDIFENVPDPAISRNSLLTLYHSLIFGKLSSNTQLNVKEIEDLASIKTLHLDFPKTINITNEGINDLCRSGIRRLASLTTLNLDFTECGFVTDKGIEVLSREGLHHLTGLTTLSLNFTRSNSLDSIFTFDKISDQGIELLSCYGLGPRTSLTALTLNFECCFAISDSGIKSLCLEALQHLNSLKKLELSFARCSKVTDKGIEILASEGIRHLTSVTDLSLNFINCRKLTNAGIKSLSTEGLECLNSLTKLKLEFSGCDKITDNGFKILSSQIVRFKETLTTLVLSFERCSEITDEGIKSLCTEALRNFEMLEVLNLNFADCFDITDQGIQSLSSEGLRFLSSLTNFSLNLMGCDEITDEGLKNFNLEWIKSLTLNEVNMNFNQCEQISWQGWKKFQLEMSSLKVLEKNEIKSEILPVPSSNFEKIIAFGNINPNENQETEVDEQSHLILLQSLIFSEFAENIENRKLLSQDILIFPKEIKTLKLGFPKSVKITDNGFKKLNFYGIQHLLSLENLELDFDDAGTLTDEGLEALRVDGIQDLRSLKTLDLNLTGCSQITVKGLKILGCQALNSLSTLKLNFKDCSLIQDEALESLSCCIRNLPSLSALSLCFSGYITDEGLNSLGSQGIGHLASLSKLHLEFSECSKITNEGLRMLGDQGIQQLCLLNSLNLGLRSCKSIKDDGLVHVIPKLEINELELNFSSCTITDQGLKNLAVERIQYLTGIKILNLNFSNCEITDEGLKNLSTLGLQSLVTLDRLKLDFSKVKIKDEGLSYLMSGVRHLASLNTFVLNLEGCSDITNKGLQNLCSQGIRYLISLVNLKFNLKNCAKITDEGFLDLKRILSYFELKDYEL